jgi:DNA-binding SARP family transcriptional activator/tetratricopeptide (TPR) repeat protein
MQPASVDDGSAAPIPVRITLLGQPRVLAADGSREFALVRKSLNVLAYLVLNRGRPTARDSVAFALFPDDDEDVARGHLRRNLSYLLSSLPPRSETTRFVRIDGDKMVWNDAALADIDVIAFERAIAEGRDDDAVAEYGGDLLPTLYEEWTNAKRERLRDDYHAALTRTIERDRSIRRFDRATATAHKLLDADPWREDIVRQLMAIRYEAGDRAGALSEFERFGARLRAELSVEPMAETFAVRDAILRGSRLASSLPVDRRSPQDETSTMTLPFVGRDDALRSAVDWWHSAADHGAGYLFVSGRAGIGKSRFAAELARKVEYEGGIVVRGETSAGGEYRPYEAFIEALRSATRTRAASGPRGKGDVWQRVLDELLDEHAQATFVDDRAARIRLFDSVRRGLADLAHARPVALIIEDLHWAGSATIDLLEFVATRLGETQLLIVATFRSDELSPAHPIRALRRQLTSHGSGREIVLEPLDDRAAVAAARGTEIDFSEEQLAQAVERAAGVPLLLVEALRDIAAGRDVGTGGIEDLFGSRLSRLSQAAETALVYGAVIGARFDLSVLAATTGWSDDEIVDALGASIELGLVRASTPGLTFSFTHHLVHRVALDRIAAADRSKVHALVARALASLPQHHGAGSGEIARHYLAAGVPHKAAEHFLTAARYARDVYANSEACDMATAGLELLAAGDPATAAMRQDFLIVRESAFARIGDLARRRADALALYALSADDPERVCAALERVFEAHRDDAVVRQETLEHLAALAPLSLRNGAIYERTLAANAFADANFPAARDAALRSVQLFDQLGDVRSAFFARSQYIHSLCRIGDFASASRDIAEQRPLCETSDDLELRMEFYRVASSVSSGAGRFDVGLTDARQSLELALRVGDRFGEARARHNVAFFLAMMSEYEQAIREQERTLEAYTLVADTAGIANTIVNLASVRGFCGDHAGAEALLGRLSDEALAFPYVALMTSVNRACFALRSDTIDDAERHLIAATELASRFQTVLLAARIGSRYGEFCARSGREDEALTYLTDALAAYTSLSERAMMIEAHALIARLRAGNGDFETARTHASQAAALTDDTPIQHFAEHAWHLAAAYELMGDHGEARQFAERAARAFVDEATRMDAELAESYARLPWHMHAIAYLNDQPVPLRLRDTIAG